MLFVLFWGSHRHFWCLFAELLPLWQGCLTMPLSRRLALASQPNDQDPVLEVLMDGGDGWGAAERSRKSSSDHGPARL